MKSLRVFAYVTFALISAFMIFINFMPALAVFNGFRLFFSVALITATGFAIFVEVKTGKVPWYYFLIALLLLTGSIFSGRLQMFMYKLNEDERQAAAEAELARQDSLLKIIEEREKPKPEPFYHYYKKDEICELNIRELQNIGNIEMRANLPKARKSKRKMTTENLGTDRFRVIGQMQTVHRFLKNDNEAIIKMMKPFSEPFKQTATGFMLQFKDKKTVDNLKLNVFYEVTGRLKLSPLFKKYNTIEEFKKKEQTYGAYLEVESFREVNPPEDLLIRKMSKIPPFNPVIPMSDSLMEVIKNAKQDEKLR